MLLRPALALLALPLLARAQLAREYAAGSYVLAQDSTRRLTGQLRLKSQRKLLVVTPAGQKLRFKPAQVRSFQVGNRQYGVIRQVENYRLPKANLLKAVFAERVDSGRVVLWRYAYLHNTGFGWLWLYRYPVWGDYYLQVGRGKPQVARDCTGCDNPYFACLLCSVLQSRPDLLRLLNERRIGRDNLPVLIHALNRGEALALPVPPPRPPRPAPE